MKLVEPISSRNHPAVKKVRALQQRDVRDEVGLFCAEGVRFLSEACATHANIETIIFAPQMLVSSYATRMIKHARYRGIKTIALTPEVLQSLALNDEPQGVITICRQQWTPLPQANLQNGICWIALDEVQSPGNLGTMIRTADAAGASGFTFLGTQPDPYHPACVRASMGAIFNVPFVRASDDEFWHWKAQHELHCIGTSPHAAPLHSELHYPSPCVIFMGGERKGLSASQQAKCDAMVRIPMTGRADSLNLAVATGIILYEILRQKGVSRAMPQTAGAG